MRHGALTKGTPRGSVCPPSIRFNSEYEELGNVEVELQDEILRLPEGSDCKVQV